jgi:hypothetical protein
MKPHSQQQSTNQRNCWHMQHALFLFHWNLSLFLLHTIYYSIYITTSPWRRNHFSRIDPPGAGEEWITQCLLNNKNNKSLSMTADDPIKQQFFGLFVHSIIHGRFHGMAGETNICIDWLSDCCLLVTLSCCIVSVILISHTKIQSHDGFCCKRHMISNFNRRNGWHVVNTVPVQEVRTVKLQ